MDGGHRTNGAVHGEGGILVTEGRSAYWRPPVSLRGPDDQPTAWFADIILTAMSSDQSHREFWDWFDKHEKEFFNLDLTRAGGREELFDQFAAALAKVDRDLSFEFGPCEVRRELVISASGIRRAFPAVTSLLQAAPDLIRWKLTAFRPRRDPSTFVTWRGKCVHSDDVRFELLHDGQIAGIELFIPGYREDDPDIKQIAYILLDHVLGEFDVEMKVGLIRIRSANASITGGMEQLSALPVRFDRLVAHLEHRSKKPS